MMPMRMMTGCGVGVMDSGVMLVRVFLSMESWREKFCFGMHMRTIIAAVRVEIRPECRLNTKIAEGNEQNKDKARRSSVLGAYHGSIPVRPPSLYK